MKKKFTFISIIVLATLFTSNAQFGGLLNKAKNTVNKKEEKKAEEKKPEAKKAEETTDNSPDGQETTAERQKKEAEEQNTKANVQFSSNPNAGKIFFSKSNITNENPDPSNLQTEFSGSDMIYAKCYLTQELYFLDYSHYKEEVVHSDLFRVEMYINDVLLWDVKEVKDALKSNYYYGYFIRTNLHDYLKILPEEALKKTTFELGINHKTNELIEQPGEKQPNLWPLVVNALKPGTYTIKLILYGGFKKDQSSKEPFCSGEFKYIKKQGDIINFGQPYSAVAPKAGMVNPSLEAKVKNLVNNYTTYQQGHKMLKVIIVEKDWEIVHHDISYKIVCRTIGAWGIIKNADGSCMQITTRVTETYDGKTYSNAYLREGFTKTNGDTNDPYVDCSTVK